MHAGHKNTCKTFFAGGRGGLGLKSIWCKEVHFFPPPLQASLAEGDETYNIRGRHVTMGRPCKHE